MSQRTITGQVRGYTITGQVPAAPVLTARTGRVLCADFACELSPAGIPAGSDATATFLVKRLRLDEKHEPLVRITFV